MLKVHIVSLIIIVFLVAASNIVFFYLQHVNERDSLKGLLVQHVALQNQSGISIANGISSDLNSMMQTIQHVAQLQSIKNTLIFDLQSDNAYGNNTRYFLDFIDYQINNTYDGIKQKGDRLYILNDNGTIINSFAPPGADKYMGQDLSFREYVNQTEESKSPIFSDLFRGLDGINRVTLTYPIINNFTSDSQMNENLPNNISTSISGNSTRYQGLVAVSMPVLQIFERYGNTYNSEDQFLVAYDKNGTIMVTPRSDFVGKNFLSSEVQEAFNKDGIYNRIVNNLLNGIPDQGLYASDLGERYMSAIPINVDNNFAYGLTMVTPTKSIYESINDVMYIQRIQSALLFVTMSGGVIVVAFILRNWSRDLSNEVLKRTHEYNEAKRRVEIINEQLISSEKAKEEFISMVSHEMRTPLMPIKAFAGMLLKPKYTGEINEKQRKAIESILRNVTAIERLVGDVLDVYRLEMNRLKLSKEEKNIKSLIETTISEFNQIIRDRDSEKNISLEADIRVDPYLVAKLDPQRINQVLGNLIKNSIDFVPPKDGKITVRVEKISNTNENGKSNPKYTEEILITVEDNGPGIPADKINNMFRKFYQIDTTLTRKHGGTGLGVVICKGIIESHGGKIWIDRNYKNGASFKFTLPL